MPSTPPYSPRPNPPPPPPPPSPNPPLPPPAPPPPTPRRPPPVPCCCARRDAALACRTSRSRLRASARLARAAFFSSAARSARCFWRSRRASLASSSPVEGVVGRQYSADVRPAALPLLGPWVFFGSALAPRHLAHHRPAAAPCAAHVLPLADGCDATAPRPVGGATGLSARGSPPPPWPCEPNPPPLLPHTLAAREPNPLTHTHTPYQLAMRPPPRTLTVRAVPGNGALVAEGKTTGKCGCSAADPLGCPMLAIDPARSTEMRLAAARAGWVGGKDRQPRSSAAAN